MKLGVGQGQKRSFAPILIGVSTDPLNPTHQGWSTMMKSNWSQDFNTDENNEIFVSLPVQPQGPN